MKLAQLVSICSAGLVAVVVVALSRYTASLTRPLDDDQPLHGSAVPVLGTELAAHPARYHRSRVVLEGVWHRGFEISELTVAKGQSFSIWVDLWDSKAFATESRKFFDVVSSELGLTKYDDLRLRAEGSFFYQPKPDEYGWGHFGHMGLAEARFLVDRILVLDRVDAEKRK